MTVQVLTSTEGWAQSTQTSSRVLGSELHTAAFGGWEGPSRAAVPLSRPRLILLVGAHHDTCCDLVPQILCIARLHVALCGFSSISVIQHCHGGAVPVFPEPELDQVASPCA